MSATGRGAERRADDFYETPGWCTRAILPHLIPNLPERHIVLEPGSGSGSIARELLAAGVTRERLMLIELDADRATQCCEDLRCVVNNWDFVTWAKHNEGLPDFKHARTIRFLHTTVPSPCAIASISSSRIPPTRLRLSSSRPL